jgi:hypothetical protein
MDRKMKNLASALFLSTALAVPTISIAQSSFDGTWKTNMAQAKFSLKPNVFYLSQGWYHCVSCNPAIDAKADGTDQAVTGASYDTLSVKEVDQNTLAFVAKKAGKLDFEQTRTVSADGKAITIKTTSHPLNSDQTVTAEVSAKRVGIKPSGVHATSGEWQISKVSQSENGLLTTYKTNGDELTMTNPTGESFTAKFDGQDYPAKGAYTYDAVSLKKIDDHTIEETDKRGGKVVSVSKMTVTGKSMKIEFTNKLTDRTNILVATKQ